MIVTHNRKGDGQAEEIELHIIRVNKTYWQRKLDSIYRQMERPGKLVLPNSFHNHFLYVFQLVSVPRPSVLSGDIGRLNNTWWWIGGLFFWVLEPLEIINEYRTNVQTLATCWEVCKTFGKLQETNVFALYNMHTHSYI